MKYPSTEYLKHAFIFCRKLRVIKQDWTKTAILPNLKVKVSPKQKKKTILNPQIPCYRTDNAKRTSNHSPNKQLKKHLWNVILWLDPYHGDSMGPRSTIFVSFANVKLNFIQIWSQQDPDPSHICVPTYCFFFNCKITRLWIARLTITLIQIAKLKVT